MGLRLVCAGGVALAALLLLLTAAILRLVVLLVQLVTPRYTLAACASALALWLVESRRQRCAKGFYSCSCLPQAQPAQQQQETPLVPQLAQQKHEQSQEKDAEEEETAATAAVAPVTPESLPKQLKQTTAAPPSETESEDDDSEAGAAPSASSPTSRHNKSLADVRTRSHTTDGELQRRQATRPRSSSAVGESRSTRSPAKAPVSHSSHADVLERKRRVSRRRADTGMNGVAKHQERSRRATYTSKQDVYARRSSSERLEDAMRSDGYWIGDFRVQRRLVPRRSHATSSPKAI
ncbi:hypothetical protein PF010_g29373 [Phytophthora fragariae]|uniref:Uncharacterized protein n=1 Tax=Phytophthora fragariae TaxID=53985 RepID=A0A6A3H517_9STRA|nr:hypothetical protein PF011_g28681 [Phytophthora fragariae]KAE9062513.1 hypothetical protein PF010_g29373 [Phytophthora fragariae]KAE9167742.1 hypothetical protein PF004_g28719 [Phytophthora fragariae]